jgi:integrase
VSISKKRGKYVAQVWDPSIKRMRQVGTFDTRREALRAEGQAYERRVSKAETVGSFAERWTRDFPRPAASTNKHNAERVRAFAKHYAGKRLDSVTRQQARQWALEHPSEHSAIRAMFSDALRDDLVTSNPFADLGINRKTPKRRLDPDWLTIEQVHELAAKAREVHVPGTGAIVSSAILVSAYTGIRPGELFALEWGDIRPGQLVISRAVQSRTNTIGPPKNGQPRVIVLPDMAAEAIENTPRNHERLVFTSPTGRRLYQSSWHGLWNPVRCSFGRPSMHYYELRHFTATHLLELGLQPSDVAVQLGHSDGGHLVQTVYGHPSHEAARQRIRGVLDGPQPNHSQPRRNRQSL